MSLTENGVSTTKNSNSFLYEKFTTKIGRKTIERVQWDYRDNDGVLHSGIAKDFESACVQASKFGYLR